MTCSESTDSGPASEEDTSRTALVASKHSSAGDLTLAINLDCWALIFSCKSKSSRMRPSNIRTSGYALFQEGCKLWDIRNRF